MQGYPVMSPVTGKTQDVAVSGSSARNVTPIASGVVQLVCSVDCRLRFTDAAGIAVASDAPLRANVYREYATNGFAYIAAITTGAAGTLSITEMG